MSQRTALSETERERIYRGKLQGQTLAELAQELQCSVGCVRKWWRRARDGGLEGLQTRRCGAPATGVLGCCAPEVRQTAVRLKQRHPGWGPARVRVELERLPELHGCHPPSRSRLAAFFKQTCPECVAQRRSRSARAVAPPPAQMGHEVWQLDVQEGVRLADGCIASICNVRDPVGAAMIASWAVAVQTAQHWRKLTWQEHRQVLRSAFAEWQTLPDAVQTDNELGIAGSAADPFPGRLTLWLVGLGVEHRLSRPHCPTDQAHVERNHRTLDGFACDPAGLCDLPTLQHALDTSRQIYNAAFPCRASDCAGRPPLIAHPELRQPRRPYRPEWELALFDLSRVDRFLAGFTFQRKVNSGGRLSLGRQMYSVGRPWAGQTVTVRFDADQRQWTFSLDQADGQTSEIGRRPVKNLDVETLTGLAPTLLATSDPVQPWLLDVSVATFKGYDILRL